jgi:hypothetical protein
MIIRSFVNITLLIKQCFRKSVLEVVRVSETVTGAALALAPWIFGQHVEQILLVALPPPHTHTKGPQIKYVAEW